jgi:hypothetical protein
MYDTSIAGRNYRPMRPLQTIAQHPALVVLPPTQAPKPPNK